MTAGRRRLVSAVLFFCLAVKMFCAENTEQDAAAEPVPYREEEFPGWMQDLRRAEIPAETATSIFSSSLVTATAVEESLNGQGR